jgi:hypothetical protein
MDLLHAESESLHLVEDLVSGLDPLEGHATFVVCLDVRETRVPQLGDARVRSALERLRGQQSKESLDEVQPRRVGGREVKLETAMPQQPPMDRRRPMGRQIIQHHMDLPLGLDACVDVAEKRDEVLGPMLWLAPRDHLASRHVEGGEEIDRAMPQVIVGPPFGVSDVHRQDRLGALERLDLGFLVDREHDGMYSPTTSRTLATSCGSGDSLNDCVTWGCRPNVRQMRPTIV